ncbi:hypothetical protein NDU88_001840 [Pleurodeles waltl]|uniref:Uncharacterized protein n=1 Tax=Pleurodeles waltl TaxID=8319 RepID=A0AAV7R9Q2_PLEWA|nr:hypothetical protein NDU88_001840 [Pleurodeles waltl]
MEAPTPGPTGAQSGPLNPNRQGKPPRELVDSQAHAPQGTAGWRKGAPAPGHGGGPGPCRGSLNTVTQWRPPHGIRPRCLTTQGPEDEAQDDLGPSGYDRLEEGVQVGAF